jgi:hypothetical protein
MPTAYLPETWWKWTPLAEPYHRIKLSGWCRVTSNVAPTLWSFWVIIDPHFSRGLYTKILGKSHAVLLCCCQQPYWAVTTARQWPPAANSWFVCCLFAFRSEVKLRYHTHITFELAKALMIHNWDHRFEIKFESTKVTIEFHRQCHKNLISVQCVNCSGRKCRDSDLKVFNCGVRLQNHVTVPFFVHEVQTNFFYDV